LCFFHQLLDQITGFRRKKVEISVCKEVVIVEVRGKSRTHNGGYKNITSIERTFPVAGLPAPLNPLVVATDFGTERRRF
jgi:hypothetical protein